MVGEEPTRRISLSNYHKNACKSLSEGISAEAGAVIVLGVIHSLSHASTRVVRETKVEVLSREAWALIERTLRAPSASEGSEKQSERRQRRRAKEKE